MSSRTIRMVNIIVKTVLCGLLFALAIYSFFNTVALIHILYGIASLAMIGFILTADIFGAETDKSEGTVNE